MIEQKTVEQARNLDIIDFLKRYYGFTFTIRGEAYRCQQHPSLAVNSDRRSWYWHSRGIGGYGALDFLIIAQCMTFREAMKELAGIAPATVQPRQKAEQPKTLILPEKAGVPLRLYDYLCNKRGIDSEIVNTLIQEGKLYEDRRGNVVFVGFDEQGKARFASLRGTYGDCGFRMDCAGSDKRYGFNMLACVPTERLYIFESPIDAMSHASLDNAATGDRDTWKRHSRLSLAGTSDTALIFFLNKHTTVKELIFCLDNDLAGCEAAVKMAKKYTDNGLQAQIELPMGKDLNEDLMALRLIEKARQRRVNPHHRDMDI